MGLGEQVRDPWGWVAGGVAGGLGWAVTSLVPAGLAVGAAVVATKVLVGAWTDRRGRRPAGERRRPDTLPQPAPGGPADLLLRRASAAVRRLHELAGSPGDPWLADQVGGVDDDAAQALTALRDLAGRVTLVEQSVAAGDPRRLGAERARVGAERAAATDPYLRAEQDRALAALDAQLQVAARLDTLRRTLLARMENAVLGLEGLGASMGEVVALGATAVDHDRAAELVGGLAGDLETLRGGIAEAQALAAGRLPPG